MSTLTGTLALPQAAQLIEKHRATLETAVAALRRRTFHEQFAENPKAYPETAAAEGQAAYDAQLGKPFSRLKQNADGQLTAHEKSPYTGQSLGIAYPSLSSPEAYVAAARTPPDRAT